MVSVENVWGAMSIAGIIICGSIFWNMYSNRETAKAVISEQLEEKKDARLFGYQSFCINNKLYIRDLQNKTFGVAFVLLSDGPLTCDRQDISCSNP